MNRDQKAVAIAEIATQIDESHAIFAVDYRGLTVAQAAELRSNLREADARFKVVKNSLTERAADQAGAEPLKAYLIGPTALTFVRGDIALAAKALADYGRATQLLPVKGGLMDGAVLEIEQIRTLSRLPSREALYGQLVGVVASPVSGLVRTLNALLGGLAVALGQIQGKKESGEISAGEPPAAEAEAPDAGTAETADDAPAQASAEASASDAEETSAQAGDEAPPEPEAEAPAETEAPADAEAPAEQEPEVPAAAESEAEPEQQPAQQEDDQADATADVQSEDAEAKTTKED